MRLRCKRFAPIEKDMKMILAHCGNLFVEPRSLTEIYHHLVMLEVYFDWDEFSPGSKLEAMTKPHLRLGCRDYVVAIYFHAERPSVV